MAKREWKQDAERNADKSWKETITTCDFPYFGLMTDWGLLVVMGRKRKGASPWEELLPGLRLIMIKRKCMDC